MKGNDMNRGRFYLISWDRQRARTTREYGRAASVKSAIRLAQKVLPAGAEFAVTAIGRTVHEGRTRPQN